MVCCCFSGEPLNSEEAKGRRGGMYIRYLQYHEKFQISMGDACFKAPVCCLVGGFPLCFICTQIHMRYKVLNHVSPGSGWEHYECCQGHTGPCCCFVPGSCCESDLPRTCMCLEVSLCPGLAVSTNRFVMMDHYQLAPDECDNRLIRCTGPRYSKGFNNCIHLLTIFCIILSYFNRNFSKCAQLIELISEIVFFSTAGCMTAQVDYEMKYREALAGPVQVTNSPIPPTATLVAGTPYPNGGPPATESMNR